MLYAGICHTDLHYGTNDFGGSKFPLVPGHELLGKVVEVGPDVTKVKVGDYCAVGCMVDSCLDCRWCKDKEEQYCDNGMTMTYSADKKHGRVLGNQSMPTFGGYTGSQVTHEHFIIKVPDTMEMDKVAPILCAAITMYDPLRHWGFLDGGKKKCVGVVGVGGLGTMGIKIAKAAGHEVVAISTSKGKEQMAKDKGADLFVVSTDEESVKACAGKCDIILSTVSANHDLNVYIPLLAKSGNLVQIGAATAPHTLSQLPLMFGRLSVSGSIIGGVEATQECVDFCAKHKVYPDCKVIEAKEIDWAWDELRKSNADGVRFVVDIKKSLENKDFLPA